GQVGGGGVDLLALTAGGLAQRCEVQQHHPGHQPTFPKSRLPPCLPSSLAGPRTMACDSALVMSYTVSAATVAPVRASISTPVRAVVRAVHSIRSSRSPCQSMAMRTPSSGSAWQNGISSWVRLAAMVPAITAVSTMPPLFERMPLARSCAATATGNATLHCAVALRAVTSLAETSTMAGRPWASTWVSAAGARGDLLRVA